LTPIPDAILRRKIFTTGQVAKFTRVAPRTVSKWFDSGKLKGYRIPGGQDRRVPRAELIRFLRDNGMPLQGLADAFKGLLFGCSKRVESAIVGQLGGEFPVQSTAAEFEAGSLLVADDPDFVVVDCSIGRAAAVRMARAIRARDEKRGRRPRLLFACAAPSGVRSRDRAVGDQEIGLIVFDVREGGAE
jgi:excisionase family DNA binding protein